MVRTLSFALLLVGTGLQAADQPSGVPADYKLLYSQDFSNPSAIKEFAFPDPAAWRLETVNGQSVLEQFQKAKYNPPHRSPGNFCLIADKQFGDFVMDVECQQTSKEYGHRDMVFVFGYQEPAKYYYSHIATKADDHANNIFIVNDKPRTKISTVTNAGNDWGAKDVWKKVRIVRDTKSGVVKVYFDDLTKPVMEAKDTTFGVGHVGFGTFDDTCRVRSVKVWSDKVTEPTFGKQLFAKPAKSPTGSK